jgi:hypothetical protein
MIIIIIIIIKSHKHCSHSFSGFQFLLLATAICDMSARNHAIVCEPYLRHITFRLVNRLFRSTAYGYEHYILGWMRIGNDFFHQLVLFAWIYYMSVNLRCLCCFMKIVNNGLMLPACDVGEKRGQVIGVNLFTNLRCFVSFSSRMRLLQEDQENGCGQ